MAKYRARPCPRCHYYLGFSVTKSPGRRKETFITSYCLNCSYKVPINRVIRGIRRTTSPLRRAALRLAAVTNRNQTIGPGAHRQAEDTQASFSPLDYTHHLRVIGQDLENLRIRTFNLECTEDAYLVWSPSGTAEENQPVARVSKNRLQKLWKKKAQPRSRGHEERFTLPSSLSTKRYRYSSRDIERMEYESRRHRRRKTSITDGHSLSQLLRTVGAVVGQRRERLLAISWQDFSISVVVETTQGRRQIDVFRPDNVYDLWVRMYLRRDNRALSDIPR